MITNNAEAIMQVQSSITTLKMYSSIFLKFIRMPIFVYQIEQWQSWKQN